MVVMVVDVWMVSVAMVMREVVPDVLHDLRVKWDVVVVVEGVVVVVMVHVGDGGADGVVLVVEGVDVWVWVWVLGV